MEYMYALERFEGDWGPITWWDQSRLRESYTDHVRHLISTNPTRQRAAAQIPAMIRDCVDDPDWGKIPGIHNIRYGAYGCTAYMGPGIFSMVNQHFQSRVLET